jgi:DNA-binding CsgD family transcriptional regulator
LQEYPQGSGGSSAESVRHLYGNVLRAVSLVAEAVGLLVTAGKAALSIGQIASAVSALKTACDLVRYVDNPALYSVALEALLTALVEAGDIGLAISLAASVDELECAGLETESLILLRVQLAWVDVAAGLPARGLARVTDARALLVGDQLHRFGPLLDAVQSCLVSQTSSDADGSTAHRLAHGVLSATAGQGGQVTGDSIAAHAACHAWEVLGVVARRHDLTESTACFRAARLLAQRHRLPLRRLHVQLELGTNEWASRGQTSRLELVRRIAERSGAVRIACAAEATIAVDLILRGQYATATRLIEQCRVLAAASDLVTVRWLAVAQSILTGHQGNRQDMERALSECTSDDGVRQVRPFTLLLANTFCSLLEEDRDRASQELNEAARCDEEAPGPYPLAGWEGLQLLLVRYEGSIADSSDPEHLTATTGMTFWSLPFLMFGRAVLLGRQGRQVEARSAVAQAERAAQPYPLIHHLGLRWLAEAAYRDEWGAPAAWLRTAEQYFHDSQHPAIANACRSLLRQMGAPTPQRRQDVDRIPPALRTLGVTVREHEVLTALTHRRGNKDIATMLCISPRTVEKHIASLLAKTHQPDREALIGFAAAAAPLPGPVTRPGRPLEGAVFPSEGDHRVAAVVLAVPPHITENQEVIGGRDDPVDCADGRRHSPLDQRDAVLHPVRYIGEPIARGGREMPCEVALTPAQHVESERLLCADGRERAALPKERDQDQRRLQRDRGKGVHGTADRLMPRRGRDHRDPRGPAPHELTESRDVGLMLGRRDRRHVGSHDIGTTSWLCMADAVATSA